MDDSPAKKALSQHAAIGQSLIFNVTNKVNMLMDKVGVTEEELQKAVSDREGEGELPLPPLIEHDPAPEAEESLALVKQDSKV